MTSNWIVPYSKGSLLWELSKLKLCSDRDGHGYRSTRRFPGRVSPGTGTGSNFSGPENPRVHGGSVNIEFIGEINPFRGSWTWLPAIKGTPKLSLRA